MIQSAVLYQCCVGTTLLCQSSAVAKMPSSASVHVSRVLVQCKQHRWCLSSAVPTSCSSWLLLFFFFCHLQSSKLCIGEFLPNAWWCSTVPFCYWKPTAQSFFHWKHRLCLEPNWLKHFFLLLHQRFLMQASIFNWKPGVLPVFHWQTSQPAYSSIVTCIGAGSPLELTLR